MKGFARIFGAALIGLALSALPALAGVTAVSVGSSSTVIFAANDVGSNRAYLLLQNQGVNPAWCAFNTSNAATTSWVYLAPVNGYYEVNALGAAPTGSSPGFLLQAYDVACISQNTGTTVIGWDR